MARCEWEVEDGKELLWRVIRKVCVKEKLFINAAKPLLSTAPKLTCNRPFQIPLATVSLQQNNPFSKLRSLAFAQREPFRTDSNPHRRYPETLRFSVSPVT